MAGVRGLYARTEALAARPEVLDALIESMGLTVLVLYGPVTLPTTVQAQNPLPASVAHGQAPGVRLTQDDTSLRACIQVARQRSLQVWFCLSGWWDNAQHAPDLVAQDVWGRPLSLVPLRSYSTEQQMGLTYCPSRPRLQDWFALLYRTLLQEYDLDALDLTHARFTHPAFFDGLWACGCLDCVRRGQDLGYDVLPLAAAVRTFVDGIADWRGAVKAILTEACLVARPTRNPGAG